MAETADAIIIGAGVIGAALAFEMAKAGRKVLSLDRARMAGQGSTAGSCAIIRMHYSTFDGTAFAWEGFHYWRDWAEYLGLPPGTELAKFVRCGCMVMKCDLNDNLSKHIHFSKELGIPHEEWDAAKIMERLPIYDLRKHYPPKRPGDPGFAEPTGGALQGGVYWPDAGYVTDPALSAQNLAAAAARHGARAMMGVEVSEILSEGGRATGVKLADGREIHAPVVVNVAGPGSAIINEMAGVTGDMTIQTRPLRQEVVHIPAPEGFDVEKLGMVTSDSDIAVYTRPEHGNNILIGSEDPPCDTMEWTEDDIHYNRDFTEQWQVQAMRYGQRVPSLGIPSKMRGVVDLYDASTDWIPIYDKSALDGFYMACGTSGNQFKNAAIAGKMMLAIIENCEGGADQDSDPLQYTLPYIGREIDTGFYSRKRKINQESSFSVLG